jgi:hypothetical protein
MFYLNFDSYWFRDALELRLNDMADKLLTEWQAGNARHKKATTLSP